MIHHHNIQIDPFFRQGNNKAAVLLLHSFTGTPDCMRSLANNLHQQGFTIAAPLLAGHGSTREKLAKTNWKDWYKSVTEAYEELQNAYDQVFVAGLSLGGILSLKLAQDFPEKISGMACLATPIFLHSLVHASLPVVMNTPLRLIYRYQKKPKSDVKDPVAQKNYWNIKDMPLICVNSLMQLQKHVKKNLPKVVCPTLLIHSRNDSTAPYESMNEIAKNISTSVTETVTLENSFHLITIDYEKDLVSQKVGDFFNTILQTHQK